MSTSRTINYVALPILLVAAVLGLYWVWGALFLWWLVPSIMTGQTALVFDITRDQDPILFWVVAILWAVFGLMMIAASLFPSYAIWLV
ncbi:hypothetical protein [Ruegeria meonggei]|uniref:Uncharacterized protein n=1 Tax=Ruegeria meonggei TaxID=1446476 RepID=A0A1X6YWW1_9RHOB|nr:hypothetical protein [Ruegeria meonggei]SLN33152.1 hypothetical protein RUM8411_01408 [Ruegeria meonggei]